MNNVDCPYCGASQEIDHEGEFEEDELFETECSECEMSFGYKMEMTISYDALAVPCFNGMPHDIVISVYDYRFLNCPEQQYLETSMCKHCGKKQYKWLANKEDGLIDGKWIQKKTT